jgi:hypothetical protein
VAASVYIPYFHLRPHFLSLMTPILAEFSPGALVRARGREWVVQPGSTADALSLRPLGGSEEDIALILPDLEFTPSSLCLIPHATAATKPPRSCAMRST